MKDIIAKTQLLDSRLNLATDFDILEPFSFDASSPIAVQEAAKKIAQHLGLGNLTFVISYASQEKDVGGHINLNSSNDVFIEVADKFKSNHLAVLAILAHEICHKFLFINNIHLTIELENERLTDLTTVYCGLGKLSLNGCTTERKWKERKADGEVEYTQTNKVGYLTEDEFCIAYAFICYIRKLPDEKISAGLKEGVWSNVISLRNRYKWNFSDELFNSSVLIDEINSSVEHKDALKSLGRLQKTVTLFEEVSIPSIRSYTQACHNLRRERLESLKQILNEARQGKRSSTYLKNLEFKSSFKKLNKELEQAETTANQINSKLCECLSSDDLSPKSEESSSVLRQFHCPCCNHKMKISKSVVASVKCPKCDYRFFVDTTPDISLKKKGNTKNKQKVSSTSSWISKVMGKFRGSG